jgi:hypothetical protein
MILGCNKKAFLNLTATLLDSVLNYTGLQNHDEQTFFGGKYSTGVQDVWLQFPVFQWGERPSFTSTVNPVLVGMVFPRNDNIWTFTVKKIRSVNFKAVTVRFCFIFQFFESYNAYRHKNDISCQFHMSLMCLQRSISRWVLSYGMWCHALQYEVHQHLGGMYCIHHLDLRESQARIQMNQVAWVLLVSFLTYSSTLKTVFFIVTAVRLLDPTYTTSQFQVFHRSSYL